MATYRNLTGCKDLHLSYSPHIKLQISRPLNDEIFSSLQYLSEIDEVGYDFIRSRGFKGKKEIKNIYLKFQAFIRQGKTFFESAETLEYRAQPLFYYYSFLNLTKAYLIINNPLIFKKKLYHGIVHHHKKIEFTKQTVKTNGGVFPFLYEQLTGNPIKRFTILNISSLFGYIPEIAYEYGLVNYGIRKNSAGMSKIITNDKSGEFWPVLAIIHNRELFENKKYFNEFFNFFDQVSMPKADARVVFGIDAAKMDHWAFMQGRKTYKANPAGEIPGILQEARDVVKTCIKPIIQKSEFDFNIFMPLKRNLQIDFNDTLASYVIMYYLGSLVRYFPEYLESLLNSKHAWIIENFTKSATSSFLININNLIQQKCFLYY